MVEPYRALVELWNGSTWTETTDLGTARQVLSAGGTYTSTLAFGGIDAPPSANSGKTESWNGSAWTEKADLNTARREAMAAAASNTAALCFGGKEPSSSAKNELWNGTCWSENC